MLDLAGGGVLVEGVGDLGMREAEFFVDQQELENAGSVRRQKIDLQSDLRHDDLHHKADVGDLVEHFAGTLDGKTGLARNDGDKRRLHAGHGQHDGNLLIGDPLFEHLVFRAVRRDFIVPVVDLLAEPDQILSDFQRYPSCIFGFCRFGPLRYMREKCEELAINLQFKFIC